MADSQSNIAEVERLLDQLAAGFSFTRPGVEGSVGDDCLDVVARGIADRTIARQEDAEGNEIAANRGRYGVTKRAQGVPVGIGLYGSVKGGHRPGGEMMSMLQLRGTRVITDLEATMTYGVEDFPRRKSQWFTRGSSGPGEGETSGAVGQPPRPFYALDDMIRAEVYDYLRVQLKVYMAGL